MTTTETETLINEEDIPKTHSTQDITSTESTKDCTQQCNEETNIHSKRLWRMMQITISIYQEYWLLFMSISAYLRIQILHQSKSTQLK